MIGQMKTHHVISTRNSKLNSNIYIVRPIRNEILTRNAQVLSSPVAPCCLSISLQPATDKQMNLLVESEFCTATNAFIVVIAQIILQLSHSLVTDIESYPCFHSSHVPSNYTTNYRVPNYYQLHQPISTLSIFS